MKKNCRVRAGCLSIFLALLLALLGACGSSQGSMLVESYPLSSQEKADQEKSQQAADSDSYELPEEKENKTEATTLETAEPSEKHEATSEKEPQAEAGQGIIQRFLEIALVPVGSTLYVWGGGWNQEDTGAGVEAVTIGPAPTWSDFYESQDGSYDYQTTRYQIHDGLDCSGYVGWAVYNTVETESGREGYVTKSTEMASFLAEKGLGEYIDKQTIADQLDTAFQPGDICSMKGHVWICLEQMEDGSVVLVHASPPGVSICGTLSETGEETMATNKARQWMEQDYPEYFHKFPKYQVSHEYLERSSIFRFAR